MEIERKWLIDPKKVPYDLSKAEIWEITQAYISFLPTIRIRTINDEQYLMTVKCHPHPEKEHGIASEEHEFPIAREEYEALLSLTQGTTVQKTRHRLPLENGLLAEIDFFHGALEGLAYMEIEFETVEQALAYPTPDWVLRDVTRDPRFKNASLARDGMPDLNL